MHTELIKSPSIREKNSVHRQYFHDFCAIHSLLFQPGMDTYISILRGINVSGHNKIAMAALKSLYEELEFQNVTSYIQSGNVVFKAEEQDDKLLGHKIEKGIMDKFRLEVPVLVRTVDEMEYTLHNNPFLKERGIDMERLHVTFLAEPPLPQNLQSLDGIDYPPDRFIIQGNDVYLYCPAGYGNSKLNNTFFERKLKVTATTRNWRTIGKLVEMGKG